MSQNFQTMAGALDGIILNLNRYRELSLAQSRADYITANGQWRAADEIKGQFYPPDGPVIPETTLDDPSDIRFNEGHIYRRLTLFSDNVRPLNYVGGNSGGEPEHNHQLEWAVLCAASENEQRKTVFRNGIRDIAAVLNPLKDTGLTHPDSGESLAISFVLNGVDYQAHDIGDHVVQAAFIGLSFTLYAPSILS